MTESDSSQEFDAQAWLDDLERAGEEHRQVVQLRPTGDVLGPLLAEIARSSQRILNLARVHYCLAAGMSPTQTYAWKPATGSIAEQDVSRWDAPTVAFSASPDLQSTHWLDTNPIRNPTVRAIEHLTRCSNTALDHLAAVGDLLAIEGGALRAPLTLTRTVLEAASVACFLTDLDVGPQERLRRAMNVHFNDVKEGANFTGDAEISERLLTELDELREFAIQLGFSVTPHNRKRWTPPVIHGDGETRPASAMSMAELLLPGIGRTTYRSLSAVAHSYRPPIHIAGEHAIWIEVDSWQRTEGIAWHLIAPLLAVDEMLKRLQAYLGWEIGSDKAVFEEVIKALMIAGGLRDQEIREHLGLPPRNT
ncbi:hypothetical protein [Nocardioides sp. L-11A]|uniref:hypothetical protein n=1 Tax=Nocardioides sp. L-11A TaxID=3043848 RepID=UPI002499BF04|nr:hypothetical protein QJ852_15290 [Nocardioides sp. L-11A]